MTITEGDIWEFMTTEKPFVDYFERLKSIGMSFNEIQSKLPQMQKYYHQMVVEGSVHINIPSLETLFNGWKEYNLIPY